MREIIRQIIKDATIPLYGCHGMLHWNRVAEYGRIIAQREDLDQWFLLLFAYFHDCQRVNEGRDPEHGPRAAYYLMTYATDAIGLSEEDQIRLATACRYHTHECETSDATIRACWDCDRLDIGRVGMRVNPKYLFTKTAHSIVGGELSVTFENQNDYMDML